MRLCAKPEPRPLLAKSVLYRIINTLDYYLGGGREAKCTTTTLRASIYVQYICSTKSPHLGIVYLASPRSSLISFTTRKPIIFLYLNPISQFTSSPPGGRASIRDLPRRGKKAGRIVQHSYYICTYVSSERNSLYVLGTIFPLT